MHAMTKGSALIASIEYNHDCICSDVPERHPDTSITYLAELMDDGKNISHLFHFEGGNMRAFLEAIRRHRITKDVKVLRKSKDSIDAITTTREDASTKTALRTAGCAFISNPTYFDAVEKIHIFAPSFESLKLFLDTLKDSHNIKVRSKHFVEEGERLHPENLVRSGFLDFVSASELLTKRQAEALGLASRLRYYDVPKGIALSGIADKMNISEAAAGELLRKAQKKLMPTIGRIIETRG